MVKKGNDLIIKLNRKIAYSVMLIAVFLLGAFTSFILVNPLLNGRLDRRPSYKADTSVLGKSQEVVNKVDRNVPDGFPENFPVYNGADLFDTWRADVNEARGLSVVWTTNVKVADVYEFYLENLSQEGWKFSVVSDKTSASTISFDKEDSFGQAVCIDANSCEVAGFISINGEDGKETNISVTMGIKRRQ